MRSSSEPSPTVLLELVQRLVVALVDRPEMVRISQVTGESAVIIEIEAGRPEVGQIIGRAGRNVHALQDVVMAVGAKHGIACQVVVLDRPGEGESGRDPRLERR